MKDEAVSKISLRDSFNEDEANYDAARPGYPRELYEDVFTYAKERISGTRAIEVGIGTGQATKPFLDAGFQVTAIEIGDKLAALAAEKFRDYPGFRVLCADFMEALPGEEACADLIYAGTAFHWLPKPDGWQTAA